MNAGMVIASQIIIQQQILIAATNIAAMERQMRLVKGQSLDTEEFGPVEVIDVLESIYFTGRVAYAVKQIATGEIYVQDELTPRTV